MFQFLIVYCIIFIGIVNLNYYYLELMNYNTIRMWSNTQIQSIDSRISYVFTKTTNIGMIPKL